MLMCICQTCDVTAAKATRHHVDTAKPVYTIPHTLYNYRLKTTVVFYFSDTMRILALVDGSDNALNVVQTAIRTFSNTKDARLTLVQVAHYGEATYAQDDKGLLKQELGRRYGALAFGSDMAIDCHAEFTGKDVRERLVEVTKELKGDVLVVGESSRHGLGRMLTGDTCEYILKHVAVPVLFVPQASAPSAMQQQQHQHTTTGSKMHAKDMPAEVVTTAATTRRR
eukprot:TRINITY_DN8353_c0_g1_i1.p1 TRINITY_DN8353_c0_g1~~TRINITY_DN8353_c0_g1_i1.p1  ORF type:complete len:225 (+),score=38.49 TRINITY_DN8353_c0_g1_i1:589-1263(+)